MLQIIRYSDTSFLPSSIQETPEHVIQQDLVTKLSIVAFQHPDKIKDALSYVWSENHKMQVIAVQMGFPVATAQQQLEQRLSKKTVFQRLTFMVYVV